MKDFIEFKFNPGDNSELMAYEPYSDKFRNTERERWEAARLEAERKKFFSVWNDQLFTKIKTIRW